MDKSSAPAYSIGKRSKQGQSVTPGPSDYDFKPSSLGKRTPICLLGKSARLVSREDEVPGPGSYTINMEYLANHSKTVSFGAKTSSSRPTTQPVAPGPGQYNIGPARTSPMYSIGSKVPAPPSDLTPAPNAYSVLSP
jgi:hypothetical protein